jgi:hypothetical protein
MFHDTPLAWSDFFGGGSAASGSGAGVLNPAPGDDPNAGVPPDTTLEIIKSGATAADARNVQELQRRIQSVGGALTANPNSTDYIVAVNNRLKFSVTQLANGQFVIRESSNFALLIGLAAIAGVVVLSRR